MQNEQETLQRLSANICMKLNTRGSCCQGFVLNQTTYVVSMKGYQEGTTNDSNVTIKYRGNSTLWIHNEGKHSQLTC